MRDQLLSAGHGGGVHSGLHPHLLIVNVRYVDRNRADSHQHHQTIQLGAPARSSLAFVQPTTSLENLMMAMLRFFPLLNGARHGVEQ